MTALFVLPAVAVPATDALAKPKKRVEDADGAQIKAAGYSTGETVRRAAPILAVISLGAQRIQVYRNGKLIGQSVVSSGKEGYRTPTGIFPILEKKRIHFSRTYDNAPMPFMMRLTWQGVALHAGHVPGYPASHGCIRLPASFARWLFETASTDSRVVVTRGNRTTRTAEKDAPAARPVVTRE